MSSRQAHVEPQGPLRADQIKDGDPYELSNGHKIRCMSAGERHGKANVQGALAVASDPAVQGDAGTDVGIEFNDGHNLRAPDLVVGIAGEPGWSRHVPALCIEYADRGQDEAELREKIHELLGIGVQHLWVVRLVGPLRVEVYQPGQKMRLVDADGVLSAPGVLANTYSPRELVDQRAALQAAFRNQLQTLGYQSLDEVRAEAREQAEAAQRKAEAALKQAEADRRKAEADRRKAEADQLAALRSFIEDTCAMLSIELNPVQRWMLDSMDAAELEALRRTLMNQRRWPAKS